MVLGKIRKNIIGSRLKGKENLKTKKSIGPKFDVIGTAESRKMFSENSGLMKKFIEISRNLGKVKEYKDPRGRFSFKEILRNEVLTIRTDKTSRVVYDLSVGSKRYNLIVSKINPRTERIAHEISIKAEILKKLGINVIEPIKGITNRLENTSILVYPEIAHLKMPREALSPKIEGALKLKMENINKKIKEVIRKEHKQLKIDPRSELEISMEHFRINPKTKKMYIIF